MTSKEIITLLESGVINVSNNYQKINKTNYFPVSDGDTGSNLRSTMLSAFDKVKKLKHKTTQKVLDAFSQGLMLGAVGNSGIVFARSFNGFINSFMFSTSKNLNLHERITLAWKAAAKEAYLTFSDCTEGTMPTIIMWTFNHLVAFWKHKSAPSISEIVHEMYDYVKKQLPALLKCFAKSDNLKLRKHIDAGALGYYYFIEGIYLNICLMQTLHFNATNICQSTDDQQLIDVLIRNRHANWQANDVGYCLEHIIQPRDNVSINDDFTTQLRSKLEQIGSTSVAVTSIYNLIKIHCHHNMPAKVIEHCTTILGAIVKSKIENMALQSYAFQQQSDAREKTKLPNVDNIVEEEHSPKKPIIFYSHFQSWISYFDKLGILGYANSVQKVDALLERLKDSKQKIWVLIHTIDNSDEQQIESQIVKSLQKIENKYQILKYDYNFECYLAALGIISKEWSKIVLSTNLYQQKSWTDDLILVYLKGEKNGPISIIVNGAPVSSVARISDIRIKQFLVHNRRQHHISDFCKVIICQEAQGSCGATKILKNLFESKCDDAQIKIKKGDESQLAYTILMQ